MRETTRNQRRISLIAAVCHVSESELAMIDESYDASMEVDNPLLLKKMLWRLGLDTYKDYVRFDALQHRNRMNQVVTCSRWYGAERSDNQWLKSGYASQEALDKARNNSILDDSYRLRGLTVDAQAYLEQRDLCVKESEE